MSRAEPTMSELFPARRYRVGDNNLAGFGPPFAMLDDQTFAAGHPAWCTTVTPSLPALSSHVHLPQLGQCRVYTSGLDLE